MNKDLSDAAIQAVSNDGFESKKGYCSRFVRQVSSKVYGDKYAGLFGASAISSCNNFLAAGLAEPHTAQNVELGDILFKRQGAGPFGHVGIYVGDRGVAENSSTSIGRIQGAKGFRSLAQFGAFDFLGRLPALQVTTTFYTLKLNDRQICVMPVKDGRALCPVRDWAEALGFDVDWDAETQHVILAGSELSAVITLLEGKSYLPVRELANFSGLKVDVDDATHIVTVSRN